MPDIFLLETNPEAVKRKARGLALAACLVLVIGEHVSRPPSACHFSSPSRTRQTRVVDGSGASGRLLSSGPCHLMHATRGDATRLGPLVSADVGTCAALLFSLNGWQAPALTPDKLANFHEEARQRHATVPEPFPTSPANSSATLPLRVGRAPHF